MNYPITIAGAIVLFAFFAHTIVGIREALSTRLHRTSAEGDVDIVIVERNWVQSLCAFQLVTVDLFVFSVLLLVLGTTDLLPARGEIALGAACFFTLWGIAWLVQLLVLRRSLKDLMGLMVRLCRLTLVGCAIAMIVVAKQVVAADCSPATQAREGVMLHRSRTEWALCLTLQSTRTHVPCAGYLIR